MRFQEAIFSEPLILTEGAVIERLGRTSSVSLDPHVLHAALVVDPGGQRALGQLYRGYLEVGRRHELPMIVLTPTWRASAQRVKRAGLGSTDLLNRQGYTFLAGIVAEYGDYARSVFIGGLMGCVGDAYRPQEALPVKEAAAAHSSQAQALAAAGVDFMLGSTLPALSEAMGMASAMASATPRAMAARGTPYLLSFVVRPDGTLLDGTPLAQAIRQIDARVSPRPLCYLLNCVHPSIYERAMRSQLAAAPWLCDRVIGLQGNTSCRSPEDLDGLAFLDTEEPESFSVAMLGLHRRFGTRVLGGCCGTDERHIEWIARGMVEQLRPGRDK